MPLFTNQDTDAGKPKFLVTDSNAPVGTRKSDVFGVDATEAAVASAGRRCHSSRLCCKKNKNKICRRYCNRYNKHIL